MTRPKRPVLRYHGGKFKIAEWVISHFPPHRVYVEPFAGAASILMQKPRSYGEVYNDIDDEIGNVFRVLRDQKKAAELERLLKLTPYSRREHQLSYQEAPDPVEQARRTIVRSFQGFGSASVTKSHKTGFRSNANRSGTTPAQDWASYPCQIESFTKRLQGVVIENRKAVEVIQQHESTQTLFYLDPPYPFDVRYRSAAWSDCYRFEMSTEDHRELAGVLNTVKGMVVISSYASVLYDEELFPKWKRVEREAYADGARPRTEVLWLNKAAEAGLAQRSLWEGGGRTLNQQPKMDFESIVWNTAALLFLKTLLALEARAITHQEAAFLLESTLEELKQFRADAIDDAKRMLKLKQAESN